VKPLLLKIDLHLHTCYSCDATSSLREVIVYAKKKGLNGVAITDHDTVKGARRALKLASGRREFKVIPGVEVSTLQGHVLALNITSLISKKLGLVETVEKIHEAGGIAVAAHPVVLVKSQIKQRIASVANLDGVEVINSSAFPFFLSTRLSQALAERLSLPQTAGSDAHHASEIGTAYTSVKVDSDIDEIIEAIRKGAVTPFGKGISWGKRVKRSALRLKMWI
jgi:predicted metal-dependent phosphoesterase TrpH